MSTEEKFKDLLHKKLGEKDFAFNPEAWENARALIDASRAKKKRIIPFIFILLGLLITGFVGFYFLNGRINLHNNTHKTTSVNKSKKVEATESKSNHSPNKKDLQSRNVKTTDNKLTNDGDIKSDIRDLKNASVLESERQAASNKKQLSQDLAKAKATNKKVGRAINAKSSQTNNINSAGESAGKSSLKFSKKTAAKAGNDDSQLIKGSDGAIAMSVKRKSKKPSVSLDEKTGGVADSNNDVNGIDSSLQVLDSKGDNEKTEINNLKPEDELSTSDASLAILPALQNSSVAVESLKPTADTSKKIIILKNIFSIEAGGNYLLGWKNEHGTDAKGFNPQIGINYLRMLTEKLRISGGVHYTTIGNLSEYTHTSKDIRYGFGQERNITAITPVKMHYLLAPIKCTYKLNEKNAVGIGYTFGYLLTVNNKVENYSEKLNSTSATTVSATKGYTEGFSPFDSQLSLFYRRLLIPNLYVNGEIFFGLTDIKDDTFFAPPNFERNKGMKITLIYNLFKK